jgi:hypothetical protein
LHCFIQQHFSAPIMSHLQADYFFLSKAKYSISNASNYVGRVPSRYSDCLQDGRSGDRIPVGGEISALVQTGPGYHPASCTMGTGSFPGVNYGRGVTLTTHVFWCRGHERVELYLYSPYGPYGLYTASVPVQGGTLPYLSARTRVHFTLPQCPYKGEL